MTVPQSILFVEVLMILVMGTLYLFARRKKDAGFVDVGWTSGLFLAVLVYFFLPGGYLPRKMLVLGMVGFWSLRLAGYILFNRVLGKSEDGRYRALREHWGLHAERNFFFFFQAQSLLVVLFSLPLLIAMQHNAASLGWWDGLGVLMWGLALAGESAADRQLARFRGVAANKGKVCRDGLWRYSRHPNYFFEWLHWLAYVAMAWAAPLGFLTLIGPLLMFVFLYKFTGIPYTEMQALKSRGEDYRRYQQTTNKFWPWIPKTQP